MYRHVMLFPTGLPGLGLMLLRISAAISVWPVPTYLVKSLGDIQSFIVFGALFVCLMAGALASVAALICFGVVATSVFLTPGHPVAPLVVSALACLSAAMMGPGAYSFDAMVYGHRIINANPCRRFPRD